MRITSIGGSRAARRACPALARDCRGAVALLGLFMAVFLTAMVAYLVGIGESVLYRERMQDAADAAAFSAAVLHARGMNLIALVNMSMAALLAVLVALKLVETVIAIALIVIALSSFFAPGLAAAIPPLSQLRTQVRTAHDELRPPIHSMLEALHAAGRALRAVVPAASVARAEQLAAAQPASPVAHVLAVPPRLTLPTVDGTFGQLCERAGEYVGATAELALGDVVPEAIAGEVAGAIADLARARADWFCGADGAAPPSTERTHTARHPALPSRQRCESVSPAAADYDAETHRALCEQAEADEQASEPLRITGHCEQACDRDVYELRAALARRACAPREGRDGLREFVWQERRFRRDYEWSRGSWRVISSQRAEEDGASYRLRRGDRRPCGRPDASVAPEWNIEPRDADGRAQPLCSDAALPTAAGRDGARRSDHHLEVTHVFGCSEQVRRRYELEPEHGADRVAEGDESASERKVPQVMEQNLELGDDSFQIRAVAVGRTPPGSSLRMIEIAAWGSEAREAATGWLARTAPALGRVALAQAEYFYAVERREAPERASFLWNMNWQARLRRFRLPEGATTDGSAADVALAPIQGACHDTLGDSGRRACRSLSAILDLVVH